MTNEDNHELAFRFATQWSKIPASHLEAALRAWNAKQQRKHALEIKSQQYKRQIELEQMKQQAAELQRSYNLYVLGLIFGFLLCTGTLTGGVVLAMYEQQFLAALLCGPSAIALTALFVLRRVVGGALLSAGRTASQVVDAQTTVG